MQALQTMTSDIDDQNNTDILNDLNDICDECKNKDESVSQNLILTLLFGKFFAWDRSVSIGSLADNHMDRRLKRPKPDRVGCASVP